MNFFDTGKKLTIGKINKFEKQINYKLPEEYVKFLLEYNGGIPEKTVFVFDVDGKEEDSVIQIFYSIDNEDKLYDLFTVYEAMVEDEEIQGYFLPIAEDEFGNNICIGLQNDNIGQIFFCDHEEDASEKMQFVSNNLNDFINALIEDNDEDDVD